MPATPTPPAKRVHVSAGAQALNSLLADVKGLSTALQTFLALPDESANVGDLEKTPIRKQRAFMQVQNLEKSWLNKKQLVAFISVLSKNTNAVDTYTVLHDEEAIKGWVMARLPVQLQTDDDFLFFN